MSAEEFFTDVVTSYKRLLLSSEEYVPGFRAYCRNRHVAYYAFVRWASTNDLASDLLAIERKKVRLQKGNVRSGKPAPLVSCKDEEAPLLYPLHIISNPGDTVVEPSPVASNKLRGVSIRFPNGVKLSVKEADSKGILFLVHGRAY
jgi:hypothetical protein